MEDDKPPLEEYFNAKSVGKDWHLYCKKCGQGWKLAKSSNRPGNILHLLNHARSHEEGE